MSSKGQLGSWAFILGIFTLVAGILVARPRLLIVGTLLLIFAAIAWMRPSTSTN